MVTVAIFPQIHYPIGEPIYNMTSGAVDGQALMAKKETGRVRRKRAKWTCGFGAGRQGRHQADFVKYGDSCPPECLMSHFCTVHLPTTTPWTRISLEAGFAPAEVTAAMRGRTEVPDGEEATT